MDALADQVAVAFANKQAFDVVANDGTTIICLPIQQRIR